ncbi:MAG: hypothetical protein AAB630_03025 [Patescibacteria group bacterium]
MKWPRKIKLMVRWSILTAALIAAFWGVWYLVAGSVPVTQLFAISRWWDILLGPIFAVVFVFLLTNDWILEKTLMCQSMNADFFGVGLICCPFLGLVYGLEIGLITGVVFLPLLVMTLCPASIVRKKIKDFLLAKEE